ncbi:dentin sialophosphoprotein-like [Glossina fuscipes]|uniref:Dentin sialophosphoprotein-like n=1 Tax=Glossina fuscipes TaxID=7396 RepID=A0A8U0WAI0_9MUSC|nr:dentin sialophosphoprotein-like [Glossina fuscipes]KAI9585519.1 hypothetical protein GQX74_001366 [Glossina fuscipes]
MLINPLNWFTGWLTIALLQGNLPALNTVQALPIDNLENPIKQLQLNLDIVSQQLKQIAKETEACKHASNSTGLNKTADHNITDITQLLENTISLDRNISHLDEEKGNLSSSSKNQSSNYPANEENVIRNIRSANAKQHHTNATASLAKSKKREESFVASATNENVPNATDETNQNDRQIDNFASFTRTDPAYAGADRQSLYSNAEAAYTISENANRFEETHMSLIDKPMQISGNQQTSTGNTQASNVIHRSHHNVSFSRPQKVYSSLDDFENNTETNGIESFNAQEERSSYDSFEQSDPLRLAINQTRNLNATNATGVTKSTLSSKPCHAASSDENMSISSEIKQQNLTRIERAINETLASNVNASLEISQKTNNDSGPLNASNVTRTDNETTTPANLDGDSYSTLNSNQLKNFIISSQSKCATEQIVTVQEPLGDANFQETDLLGFLLNQTLNATNSRRNPGPYHKTLPLPPRKRNDNYDEDDVEESESEIDASKEANVAENAENAENAEKSTATDTWEEKPSSKSVENDDSESSTESVGTIGQNLTANTVANVTDVTDVNMSNNDSEETRSDISDENLDENTTEQQNSAPNTELISNATDSNTTYVTNGTKASLNESVSHSSINITANEQNSTTNLEAIDDSPEHLNTVNYAGFEEMSLFEFLVTQLTKNLTAKHAKNASHAASLATSANLKTKTANTENVATTSFNESQAHDTTNLTLETKPSIDDVASKIEEQQNEPVTLYDVAAFREDKPNNVISTGIEQNSTVKPAAINASKSGSHIASSFAENEPVTALSKQENLNLTARATESPNSSTLTVGSQQLFNSDEDEAGGKVNIDDETRKVNDYTSFREMEVLKNLVNDIVKNLGSKDNSTNMKHSAKKTNMTHLANNKNETLKALDGTLPGKAGQAGAGNITKGPKGLVETDTDDEIAGVFKLNKIKPVIASNQQATNSTPDTNQTASLNASYTTNVTNTTSESVAASNTSSVLGETMEIANATNPTNETTATEDAIGSANKSVVAENAPGPRNESVATADETESANNNNVIIENAPESGNKSLAIENATDPTNESTATEDATGSANKSATAESASESRNETVATESETEATTGSVATQNITNPAANATSGTSESVQQANTTDVANETMSTANKTNSNNETVNASDSIESESIMAANAANSANETIGNKVSELAAIPTNVSKDIAPATNAIVESVPIAESQTIQSFASFAENNPITTFVTQAVKNETNAINETVLCDSPQEALKPKCVAADQQNFTQNTEMINVNSTSKETCSCSAHHNKVSPIRSFVEKESFATLKNPSVDVEETLAFGELKRNQETHHKDILVEENNANNHSIAARLGDLQNSTTNKTDMLSNVPYDTSKIAEDVTIDSSTYLPISVTSEEALHSLRTSTKNQSSEASATSTLAAKPTTSDNQTKPLNGTEEAKISENLKLTAFQTNSSAEEYHVHDASSSSNGFRSFAQNERRFAEKTKATNATAHNMHVSMKIGRRPQGEQIPSESFRFKADSDFYRAPHFLYMDQAIKTAKNPLANASTIHAKEEETNATLLIKNVTNSCCHANCSSTMGCENLKVEELLNTTDQINMTSSATETASLTSSLSEASNDTVQVKQAAEKTFVEEAESMGDKLSAMDQNTQDLKENSRPESSSALHNIEFLKIAQNLAYEFARGENQITEEEFGRVAKFQDDEEGEFSVDEDTKSITDEDGRESRTLEDESDYTSGQVAVELSADVEETTTIDAAESIEPEESMYRERAPRKLKHHRNLDGVEMFYGYSSVKHN